MNNWEDIANRNAQEHDENEKKFKDQYGVTPDEVSPLYDLIMRQRQKFFLACEHYFASGTANGIGSSGDGRFWH